MRNFLRLLPLFFASSQASAAVVLGVDFRDACGGLIGLAAVFFFMWLSFKGDKNPPAPGFITDKRLERQLRGDKSGGGVELEAE
jgi:L-lactate permease